LQSQRGGDGRKQGVDVRQIHAFKHEADIAVAMGVVANGSDRFGHDIAWFIE
jgi:hypothetical protein